jgi:hypothetical protein
MFRISPLLLAMVLAGCAVPRIGVVPRGDAGASAPAP